MFAPTFDRVRENTPPQVNSRIDRQTEETVAHFAAAGPAAMGLRLYELDQEWDVDRVLEVNVAVGSLVGLTLGLTVDRRFLVIPAAIAGFLLYYAFEGWCPPVSIYRRLGVRTAGEINEERFALKALRGDFHDLGMRTGRHDIADVDQVLDAVRI